MKEQTTFFPLNEEERTNLLPQPQFEIQGDVLVRCLHPVPHLAIPDGVARIGENAFAWCNILESVTLPASVKTISSFAFFGCTALQTITLSKQTQIAEDALRNCPATLEYTDSFTQPQEADMRCKAGLLVKYCGDIPRLEVPEAITAIGDAAFFGCETLTAIHIPETVTKIGDWAFEGCSNLREIHLSHRTILAATALIACPAEVLYTDEAPAKISEDFVIRDGVLIKYNGTDTNIVIPNRVTAIGDEAFQYCQGLTAVQIPDSVTVIGKGAFWKCDALTDINIPASVKTIGHCAFYSCTKLTEIHLSRSTQYYADSFKNCPARILYLNETPANNREDFEIKDGVLVKYNGNDENVVIPYGVTKIGVSAFTNSDMVTVQIPYSVETIGASAFMDCKKLTSIQIPASVKNIETFAFLGCINLNAARLSRQTQYHASAFIGTGVQKITYID